MVQVPEVRATEPVIANVRLIDQEAAETVRELARLVLAVDGGASFEVLPSSQGKDRRVIEVDVYTHLRDYQLDDLTAPWTDETRALTGLSVYALHRTQHCCKGPHD